MTREAETINGKSLLTIDEVARRIGMGKSWIKTASAVGLDFPRPVTVGARAKRWRAVDILAWERGLSGQGAGKVRA